MKQRLLNWYKKEGRKLPWRETADPYKILVSEMMLQQTQVKRVLEFYDAWLKKFPNWKTLAKATNAQVIEAWSGLGYNRRALYMRDIARHVLQHSEPQSVDDWQKIKGIGPYTAAALAVFTKQEPIMPIDTNIRRVGSRLTLGIPFPDPKDDQKLKAVLEDAFMHGKGVEDVPQALFDLANSYCTKNPHCSDCPMRAQCAAAPEFLSGSVDIPKQSIAKSREKIQKGRKYPDRIYRGRVLKLIQEKQKVSEAEIIKYLKAGRDMKWARSIIKRLEKEGFIEKNQGKYRLKQK